MRVILRAVLWWSPVTALVPLAASAQIQVAPDNATHLDPKIRLSNSTGNTVVFTITNLGGDASFVRTCTGTGNITSVSCTPLGLVAGGGGTKDVTATFATTGAGTGTVEISINLQGQPTVLGLGKWDETIVNPGATVTPDGALITKAPNLTGATQLFTVTNTSRAAGTYPMAFTCPATGVSGCTISPAALTLDSAGVAGASGPATVTYNTLAAGTAGTLTATASYNGSTLDQGSATISMPNAAVTPDGGAQTVGANLTGQTATFTIQNTGPVGATFDLTVGCTVPISSCSLSAPTVNPNPTLSQNVTVTFASGAAGAGVITVTARYGGVTLDNGTVNVSVTAPTATVTVAPVGTQPNVVAPGAAATQAFTVTNTGATAAFTLAHNCATMSPPAATGCSISSPAQPTTITGGAATTVTVSFTGSPTKGLQGTLTLQALVSAVVAGSGNATIAIPNAAATNPTAVTLNTNAAGAAVFTVTNTGTTTATFALTSLCAGQATGCGTPSPATLTLAPSIGGSTTVGYTAAATAGTGTVTIQVRYPNASGTILTTGIHTVTVQASAVAMVVDVNAAAVDSVLMRDQCVAVAVGPGAATECGDLRLAHGLPTVRSMSSPRTPMLVYNSAHANTWINLPANLTLPAGSPAPATVTAVLKINTVQVGATHSWTGGQWTAGSTRRVTIGFNAASVGLGQGIYPYVLEVTNTFAGGATMMATRTGKLVVVDRQLSPFGAGWWLSGLEALSVAGAPQVLRWYGGGGSAMEYRLRTGTISPNRIWDGPVLTYPNEIREGVNGGQSEYIRRLPDSVRVYFNATGQHVRTLNRLGHVTTFGYTSGRLTTIALPTNGAAPFVYTFNYNASNVLSSVVAPGASGNRTVMIATDASRRVTSITDPGGVRVIGFGYQATDLRVSSRTNANLAVTSFTYDAANKVASAAMPLSIQRTMTSLPVSGVNGSTTLQDPPAVRYYVNGPGPNNIAFYVNRYGAPDLVVNALSQQTALQRLLAAYPGLVTNMTTTSGQQVMAGYDAQGRLTSVTDNSWQNSTTSFQYGAFDQVAQITAPGAVVTTFTLDPGTGNRLAQVDNRGAASQINFGYDAATKLLNSVGGPGAFAETYRIDTKGNVDQSTSALGFVTNITNDGIGFPTAVTSPINSAQTQQQTMTYSYNDLNRLTGSSSSGPGESVSATHLYDLEGNVTETTTPHGTISWSYDLAGRQQTETIAGTTETRTFDVASRVTQIVDRRGLTIGMGYDALNRMTSRNYPAVPYATRSDGTWRHPTVNGFTVPAGSETFGYNAGGQMTSANNADAQVARGYNASGMLTSEVLSIRSVAGTFGQHLFTTTYGYDVAKRLISITVPSQFSNVTSQVGYGYTSWGALNTVTDVASNSFGFTYAPQGQMSGQTRPGAISESWGFDADGRRTSNALSTTTTGAFPDFGFAQLRNTTFSVDARGKVLTTSDPTSYADAQTNTYSGLGHALTSNTTQRGLTSSLQVVNMGSIEQYTVDATGNVLTGSGAISMQVNGTIAPGGSNWSYSRSYNPEGRMTAESSTGGSRVFEYDGAGNNHWQKLLGGGSTPSEHRALRYDGVGRLRRAELAWVAQTGLFPAAPFKEGTEDYYYDALGRRVLTATTSSCALGASEVQTSCLASAAVVRTIWTGDQELAEIRMPNDASYAENDIGPTSVAVSTGFDRNPYYGRVVYAQGPTVDQPLSVTRFGYTDYDNNVAVAWPTFTVVPLANWRRQSFLTAFANGDVEKQFTPGGTTCATTGAPRCVIVPRPAQYSMWEQQRGYTPPAWHGSLIEDKRESLIGLTYRRNRYYDPSSGRFTQEDPIGLAGGLNLYGFANGDPVNFSDPFGLDPCKASSAWTECLAQALADWGARRGGTLGDAALNTGAALNAVFEGIGINAAASAGDAIGSGKLGTGGVGLAMMFGPMRLGKGAVGALIRDATENPGNWRTVGAFVEGAINKKARGGISIQTIIENEAGDRLVRHTVLDRLGQVLDDHFRPMFKP